MKQLAWPKLPKNWKEKGAAFRYALPVAALGLLLLLWPEGSETKDVVNTETDTLSATVEELERKIEDALGRIEGVGEVKVVLTVDTEGENDYAVNRSMDGDRREEELVILSGQSREEQAVVRVRSAPVYRGALVVCSGGGNAQVRLEVTRAVAVLTGLGTDRISVSEGKG